MKIADTNSIYEYDDARGFSVRRRKFIATMGTITAGTAAVTGSVASVDIWADRNADIGLVQDSNGLLGIEAGEENGELVSDDGGAISIDFENLGAEASGFNAEARTTVDDIFRIRNQSGDPQVVWIKDAVEGGPLGDDGVFNFFRGPVTATGGEQFRIVSLVDPVPGTDPEKQRLSITGLVPPDAPDIPGLSRDRASKGWIEAGNPVRTDGPGFDGPPDSITFDPDADVPFSGGGGANGGRLLLSSGEEMKVGLEVNGSNNADEVDDTDVGLDEIQIVGRAPEDAKELAVEATEFSNKA